MENDKKLIEEMFKSAEIRSIIMADLQSENDELKNQVAKLKEEMRISEVQQEHLSQQLEFFKTRSWNFQEENKELLKSRDHLVERIVFVKMEKSMELTKVTLVHSRRGQECAAHCTG